jgi:predicted kinase
MKPLLVSFVGVPGSGKTTFARQLAAELNAVTLNSDAIRVSMWGSREAVWATHKNPAERARGNKLTFGALDYAAGQVLAAGYSVVYDCNANKYAERSKMAKIALKYGAESILVYIKTPHELAIQRITRREEAHDAISQNPEKAQELVERFARAIELPIPSERVVEINGEVPFGEQYKLFQSALTHL